MYNSRLNNSEVTIPKRGNREPSAQAFESPYEAQYSSPIGELLKVLWKRRWIIAAVAIVLMGAAIGYTLMQTPRYQASTNLLIEQQQTGRTVDHSLQSEVQGLQQIAQTVAAAVNNRSLAENVIQQLGLQIPPEYLQGNLRAEQFNNTQFIRVTYTDTDPTRAQQIVNAVGDQFAQQIEGKSPSTTPIKVTVWERAQTPTSSIGSSPVRYGLLGLVGGVILGAGLALLLEYLQDGWRSPEEIERVSGVPTLAILQKDPIRK